MHRPTHPVVVCDDVVGRDLLSREALIQLQKADGSLQELFDVVIDFESPGNKISYCSYDSLLVRRFLESECPQESDLGLLQIVAPVQIRRKLLELVHDIPASVHLGMLKRKERLAKHFYWRHLIKT